MQRPLMLGCLLGAVLALVWLPALGDQTPSLISGPVYGGIPLAVDPLGGLSTCGFVVLPSSAFVIGYSDARMDPLWACYHVYATTQSGSSKARSWDTDMRTSAKVADNDYAHTAGDYDRGHMVPKAAMSRCYGQAVVDETYVLTNACPQLHEFNDGVWGDLEDLVREEYSLTCVEVWVIVGPVFDDRNGQAYLVKEAGYSNMAQKPVEIPDAFYAILIDLVDGSPRALAFVMDQQAGRGSAAPRKERLAPFLTSIDNIQTRTGLDFLWLLDDQVEAQLEATIATALW